MARKKREDEPDNQSRWLVSYADFITLLFAFFVVMYAISSVNESKYRELTRSIGSAFGLKGLPSFAIDEKTAVGTVTPIQSLANRKKALGNLEIRKEREKMTGIGRDLVDIFSPFIKEGKVKVVQNASGVNVEISASILFASAEASLSSQSKEVLREVAHLLKNEPNHIQVEGFSDNLPIHSLQYPSNWELSSARASSVVRLFVENGIAENRLVAIGRAANDPIADNATPEGRSRNRRISLTVLTTLPEKVKEIAVYTGEAEEEDEESREE